MPERIALPHRGVLRISGEDRIAFLQGLLTNDVTHTVPGKALYACLLTPQGKFLHDMLVFADEESFWLDTGSARLPQLVARLTLYKLRSNVTIEDKSSSHAAYASANESNAPLQAMDPRLAILGWRMIDVAGKASRPVEDYHALRLKHGVPESDLDLIPDATLPLEARLDKLHAVDFHKGCYVGQEVTARSKHRATLRKKLYGVRSNAVLPPPETEIRYENALAGTMRSSAGHDGLAMLRVEEVDKSKGFLQAAGQEVTVFEPEWMR